MTNHKRYEKNLFILSTLAIIFICVAHQIQSIYRPSPIYPLWFLPQKNIVSFLTWYFLNNGINIAIGLLNWGILFQTACYLVKITTTKYDAAFKNIENELNKLENEYKTALEQVANLPEKESATRLYEANYKALQNDKNHLLPTLENCKKNLSDWKKKDTFFSVYVPFFYFSFAFFISLAKGLLLFKIIWKCTLP